MSGPPCSCRTDPVLLLWFYSSNILDCNKCYPFFPRLPKKSLSFHPQGQVMSAPHSPEESATCAGSAGCLLDVPLSQPCPVLQELFPQGMFAPSRAAAHLLPAETSTGPRQVSSQHAGRQASCLLSHHCPLKSPQNKLWANEADAIHQNLIKRLLHK